MAEERVDERLDWMEDMRELSSISMCFKSFQVSKIQIQRCTRVLTSIADEQGFRFWWNDGFL